MRPPLSSDAAFTHCSTLLSHSSPPPSIFPPLHTQTVRQAWLMVLPGSGESLSPRHKLVPLSHKTLTPLTLFSTFPPSLFPPQYPPGFAPPPKTHRNLDYDVSFKRALGARGAVSLFFFPPLPLHFADHTTHPFPFSLPHPSSGFYALRRGEGRVGPKAALSF